MKGNPPPLHKFLGFRYQGDFGPYTCYRAKTGRHVWFLRTSPHKPATRRQIHQRAKLTILSWLWHTLTNAERLAWSAATSKAHLRISGFNLYTYSILARDRETVRTVEFQSHTALKYPGNEP